MMCAATAIFSPSSPDRCGLSKFFVVHAAEGSAFELLAEGRLTRTGDGVASDDVASDARQEWHHAASDAFPASVGSEMVRMTRFAFIVAE